MTEALLPRIAGEGDREAVEGATPTTCGSLPPPPPPPPGRDPPIYPPPSAKLAKYCSVHLREYGWFKEDQHHLAPSCSFGNISKGKKKIFSFFTPKAYKFMTNNF